MLKNLWAGGRGTLVVCSLVATLGIAGCSASAATVGGSSPSATQQAPSASPTQTVEVDGPGYDSASALEKASTWVGTAEVVETDLRPDASSATPAPVPHVLYRVRQLSTIKGTAPAEFLVSQIDTTRVVLDGVPALPVPAKGAQVLLFLTDLHTSDGALTPTAWNRGYIQVGGDGQLSDHNFGLSVGKTLTEARSTLR